MLQHLHIENFTLIDHLDLEWHAGMSTITGETGAGKSIILDALGLVLGGRSDSSQLPLEEKKTTIIAEFSTQHHPEIEQWLSTRDLDSDEGICLLKRTMGSDGRSRAFINGQPTTLIQLKELGEQLIDIQSQHAQYALLKPAYQLQLLDEFSAHKPLVEEVNQAFHILQQKQHELDSLKKSQHQRNAQLELLSYQISELDEFNLTEEELQNLESDHKRLANAQHLQTTSLLAYDKLNSDEGENLSQHLQSVCRDLEQLAQLDENLDPIAKQLQSISIELDEACRELKSYGENLEMDPESLLLLEERLSIWQELSRKHHIDPYQLVEHHQQLQERLNALTQTEQDMGNLNQALAEAKERYFEKAHRLSKSRLQHAKKLEQKVMEQLKLLGMNHSQIQLHFEINPETPTETGLEKVQILFQPNPGLAAQPLHKIASGGELSRVSLAIQVITVAQSNLSCLVFDEVDVGIGGGTAEVVGQMLKKLSQSAQVICITHQPQVAAQGDQHLLVSKIQNATETKTQLTVLNTEQRIAEIARMLGGIEITETTLKHAQEMLKI
ncbi:MAG: DNA repair protein RecN [Gammaproteobacteria bacterium CG22_combo_CG10-13_8_21_14_all_40_8]|nr:MAG: DNA repair protein RecN [Gammaproteobacteria bacterium CG22_combo_CG10-13_8_21_14_all_40_8]